ncbi:putative membrane protein [Hamadaea flava]|nr:putative membrane protein [Hamadaea flava]
MMTFLKALHVLSAVMLVGPLMSAPFIGRRAIQRRSADGVRMAATQTRAFGAGTVLTAVLGILTVLGSDGKYEFATPWVIISMTLYVVALGLVFFYAVPALHKAARMVSEGVIDTQPEVSALTATTDDLRLKERLDAITGRVAGAGFLVLLVFAVITLLMVIRPF